MDGVVEGTFFGGTVWSALTLKMRASSTGVPLFVRAPSVAGWGQSLSAAYPCQQLLLAPHDSVSILFVLHSQLALPAKDRDGG